MIPFLLTILALLVIIGVIVAFKPPPTGGLALLVLAFAGCTGTRTVLVEQPAPPPTIVTQSDTLRLASPPDTLYLTRTLPGDTVVVERTVPRTVTLYTQPRPDTSRAYRLHGARLTTGDGGSLLLFGTREDAEFLTPVPGETLVLRGTGPDGIEAFVEGTPIPPPSLALDCPACPACTVRPGWRGKLDLLLIIVAAALLGALGGYLAGRGFGPRSGSSPDG